MRELNMTEEEIQKALEKTAIVNSKIKILLEIKPWTEWGVTFIKLIDEDLLNAAQGKTTIYIHKIEESYYTNGSENELHVEKGPEFTNVSERRHPPQAFCWSKMVGGWWISWLPIDNNQ